MNSSLKTSHLGSALLIVAVLGALLSVGGASLRPSNLTCVNNAAALALAVAQYTQDNDLHYPPTSSVQKFQAALLPFARTQSVFSCPVTGTDYQPNAALSGAALVDYSIDLGKIEVFRDGLPHADGLPTIGYADGHIERGGIDQTDPEQASLNDAKRLALAVLQYTQDNDENFPPMHTPAEMQTAIFPYVRTKLVFRSPVTGLPYIPNPVVSGKPMVDFSEPSATEMLRDPRRHRDGKFVIAYLDGHVMKR